MAEKKFTKYLPYLTAVILFLIISFAYFPEVIQGKKLSQHDVQTWKGMSKEINDYREKTGENPLWTNSMFGGMPSYLITVKTKNNVNSYIFKTIEFNQSIRPVSFIFLMMLGFFIALILFGVNPWLSIVGAIGYGFSSYFFIIIDAGHLTKVMALSFMPPIIAGVYYAYKKKVLLGSIIMMIFLSLQLLVNHLQITYYTFLIIFIFIIFELVSVIKKKSYKKFLVTSGILLLLAFVSLASNSTKMLAVYDYTPESTRGKSELTIDKNNQTTGLDKEYATGWSYGITETFNLLIPNLFGGSSVGEVSEDSHLAKEFKKVGIADKDILKSMPMYWGNQPGTSGPVYIGAIIIFLFVLGLFLVKGNIKWWLLTATILSILLAWGHNFMFLSELFLDYFPGYNKFRTVSMILVIAEFTMPLLGFLALKNIIDKKVDKKEVIRALKWTTGILSGIIIIFLINPGILSFKNASDGTRFMEMFGIRENTPETQPFINSLTAALEKDRASIFRSDAFRSLVFVLLTAGLVWLFIKDLLKQNYLFVGLAVIILVDLWSVNKRYLNSDDFIASRKAEKPYKETMADTFILKDIDPNFRVLNLTVNIFNDASTSYFHKSIGGYHGAKMKRYQELISNAIINEINILYGTLQTATDEIQIQSALMNLSVLNMLNTKYIILDPNDIPRFNRYALGNAWFVNRIKIVENADEELRSVQNFDPEQTAVIDKRFEDQFFEFKKDSSASIKLIDYAPHKLKYKSNTKSDQLAVFSEIFYDKGWKAYIDGNRVPHMRANYVLRAMKIPAGKHLIEFKFDPDAWKLGEKFSLVGSILFVLLIVFYIFWELKGRKTSNTTLTQTKEK